MYNECSLETKVRYKVDKIKASKCLFLQENPLCCGIDLLLWLCVCICRLVEVSEGLQGAQDTLLIKAVEDCFVGRHFVFGIKV